MCEKLVYIHGLLLYTYMYVFDGGGMITELSALSIYEKVSMDSHVMEAESPWL